MMHKYLSGLSLIELLVVIVIITVLATGTSSVYTTYTAQSRISAALVALEEYKIRTAQLLISEPNIATLTALKILYPDNNGTDDLTANPKVITNDNNINSISATITTTTDSHTNTIISSIVLGACLIPKSIITDGNNCIYLAYQKYKPSDASSFYTYQWNCGTSTTKGNNISDKLLPANCNSSLP